MRIFAAATSLLLSICAVSASGQNIPCNFDSERLEFEGTPVEQSRCLLRPNGIGGVLGSQLKRLPDPLEQIIGRKVGVSRKALEQLLASKNLSQEDLGGPLTKPLAQANATDGRQIAALYFVIHDTSYPYLGDEPFPSGFDSDLKWKGNDISIWKSQPVAHIFVNRLGASLTTTPFDEPVRKGFGTKFARDILKADRKGLQLHIELVQPRRRDPSDSNPKNDRIAPEPGFTPAQYETLALLYLMASVRKGTWLIPGYHSAFDAGIKDAHDDPQNFSLDQFAKSLRELLKKLK